MERVVVMNREAKKIRDEMDVSTAVEVNLLSGKLLVEDIATQPPKTRGLGQQESNDMITWAV